MIVYMILYISMWICFCTLQCYIQLLLHKKLFKIVTLWKISNSIYTNELLSNCSNVSVYQINIFTWLIGYNCQNIACLMPRQSLCSPDQCDFFLRHWELWSQKMMDCRWTSDSFVVTQVFVIVNSLRNSHLLIRLSVNLKHLSFKIGYLLEIGL